MYLKETEDIIKKKNELIRVADRTVLSEEEKQRLLKESENTEYTQGQRDKILEDLKNSLSSQEKMVNSVILHFQFMKYCMEENQLIYR